MALLDLHTGEIAPPIDNAVRLAGDTVLAADGAEGADSDQAVWRNAPAVMVVFAKFSDGRGFTIGRQLRTDWGFAGALIASGDVIADQADYLRRCGFSHAEIDAAQHPHWQFNLQSITTRFQHMAGSPRTRGWAG